MDETFLERVQWALRWLIIGKGGHALCIFIFEPLRQYDNLKFAWNIFTFTTLFVVYFTINGMYSTIMFYNAVKGDMRSPKDWQPTPKLFSFKGILLLSHLTGLVIAILVSSGAIKSAQGWDSDHVAAFLQNWCYCLILVGISILNTYAYSYTDFVEPEENEGQEAIVEVEENEGKVDIENEVDEQNKGKVN